MKIQIGLKETLKAAASRYYEKAKAARAKKERLKDEIKKTEKLLQDSSKKVEKKRIKVKKEKKWYEKFNHIYTSNGFLVIAGKDAKQNDTIFAKHLEGNDLFYHAEIHGAPATVLKNGKEAGDIDRYEAAQFAGSYSSAWKQGYTTVDVYAVEKSQVSKHDTGAFVGKGAFMIRGDRIWFKNIPLIVTVYLGTGGAEGSDAKEKADTRVCIAPGKKKVDIGIVLSPGSSKKGGVARTIVKQFNSVLPENEQLEDSDILSVLPPGDLSIVERFYKKPK